MHAKLHYITDYADDPLLIAAAKAFGIDVAAVVAERSRMDLNPSLDRIKIERETDAGWGTIEIGVNETVISAPLSIAQKVLSKALEGIPTNQHIRVFWPRFETTQNGWSRFEAENCDVRDVRGRAEYDVEAVLASLASTHYLTPAEAAERTGTGESTWRSKAASGKIPGAIKKGKQWLIPESAVAES